MRLERVSSEIVNRLFRATKVQQSLDDFSRMDDNVVRCVLAPGEYTTIRSAQQVYQKAIQRMGYRMVARVLAGDLYLIKLSTKDV